MYIQEDKIIEKNYTITLSAESGLYEWQNWKNLLPEEGQLFYIIQKMSCLPTHPMCPLIHESPRQKGQLPSAARGSCHETDFRTIFRTQQVSALHMRHHMVLPDCTYGWLGFEESIIWHSPANDLGVTPGQNGNCSRKPSTTYGYACIFISAVPSLAGW